MSLSSFCWFLLWAFITFGKPFTRGDSSFFPKCCPWGKVAGTGSCVPGPKGLPLPPVRSSSSLQPLDPSDPSIPPVKVLPLNCTFAMYFLQPDGEPEDEFFLLTNGSLVRFNVDETFNSSNYCLDFSTEYKKTIPALCFDATSEEEDQDEDWATPSKVPIIYSVGMIISLPFFVAILFVYSSLKELRNLHGKTVMSHTSALIFSYLSLLTAQLLTNDVSHAVCQSLGYMIQFGFLAIFFWLNVMCFDIWWAFSGLRVFVGSRRDAERKKFAIYSAYAWGCPFIIGCLTFTMDNAHILPPISSFKPRIGVKTCFFQGNNAFWLYFYGPMAVILISNVIMFAMTALKILRHKRETSVLHARDSSRSYNNDRKRFFIYLKLVVVMGINWFMEAISWIAGGPKEIWYLSDVTNALQGIFIAFTFICKRRLWLQLKAKYCPGFSCSFPLKSPEKDQGSNGLNPPSTNVIELTEDSVRLQKLDET